MNNEKKLFPIILYDRCYSFFAFIPTRTSGRPQIGTPGQNQIGMLAQGQLEQSNVNIVDEMVDMITAQRAYESNSKVIQASDQMLQYVNSLR